MRYLIALLLLGGVAFADPAPNFPPEHHPWLHQQYSQPIQGFPGGEHCCNEADCWVVDYRIRTPTQEGDSGYQVLFPPVAEWLNIPTERIVRAGNPTGRAILCINRVTLHIYCFFPSVEG